MLRYFGPEREPGAPGINYKGGVKLAKLPKLSLAAFVILALLAADRVVQPRNRWPRFSTKVRTGRSPSTASALPMGSALTRRGTFSSRTCAGQTPASTS